MAIPDKYNMMYMNIFTLLVNLVVYNLNIYCRPLVCTVQVLLADTYPPVRTVVTEAGAECACPWHYKITPLKWMKMQSDMSRLE